MFLRCRIVTADVYRRRLGLGRVRPGKTGKFMDYQVTNNIKAIKTGIRRNGEVCFIEVAPEDVKALAESPIVVAARICLDPGVVMECIAVELDPEVAAPDLTFTSGGVYSVSWWYGRLSSWYLSLIPTPSVESFCESPPDPQFAPSIGCRLDLLRVCDSCLPGYERDQLFSRWLFEGCFQGLTGW